MEDLGNISKRPRQEDSGEGLPEEKRLRADDIFGIFDDEDAGGDVTAVEELASVIRILEEEITIPSPGTDFSGVSPGSGDPRESDLGYLLEASDDELGLPPATTTPVSSSDCEGDVTASGEVEQEVEPEGEGFGQIWGFDDAIAGCYEGLEFGIRPEAAVFGDEVVELDGGLFDYSDMACGPSDFVDLTWRPETMPAL